MAMSVKWQRLRVVNQDSLPPLLFRFLTTSNTYELYITDLTNVWSEQLGRQEILKRADKDDTTIDPSEDQEQFNVLLQKIQDALHRKPGSSATLSRSSKGNGTLEITTLTELPAPLKPLKWALYLSKKPPSASVAHLLLPLVRAEADLESRQRVLIDQLHRKDWVLGKLFDKVETMGIDLSTVFPGVPGLRTGRKGTTSSQATKHIKGAAPFDEQAFLDEVDKSSPNSGLASNILAELTGSDDTRHIDDLEPPSDAWWEQIERNNVTSTIDSTHKERIPKATARLPVNDTATDTDAGTETDDDEFERQATPPRLKKTKPTDESSPEPEKSNKAVEQPPPQQQTKPTKSKGLGMIGGKKQTKQPTPTPQPPPPPQQQQHASPSTQRNEDETETDSGSDLEAPKSPPPPPAPKTTPAPSPAKPPPPPPGKPRGLGLGVIGGKKKELKQPTPEPEPEPTAQPAHSKPTQDPSPSPPNASSQPEPEPKPKPTNKLGTIGGKKTSKAQQPDDSASTRAPATSSSPPPAPGPGRDATPATASTKSESSPEEHKSTRVSAPEQLRSEPDPPKEETEQEKANRKREELKRQLEVKSKAPVKKKRKF